MKKEDIKKKRIPWLIYGIVIGAILVLILGTNLYLWFKLLIGNDIIININTDPKNIYLLNNEEQKVNIKTSIVANPFCDAICSYEFIDISNNISLDKQEANIKTLNSLNKEHILQAPSKGTGQVLYRVDVQCQGVKNLLCQTKGELNKKTLLVTLDYNLSSQEQQNKDNFKQNYLSIKNELSEKILYLKTIKNNINGSKLNIANIDTQIFDLEFFSNSLNSSITFWNNQSYTEANNFLNNKQSNYNLTMQRFYNFNQTLNDEIIKHNNLSLTFEKVVDNVSYLATIKLNDSDLLVAENIVASTNEIILNLNNNSIISEEQNILDLENNVNSFLNSDRDVSEGELITIPLNNYNPFVINRTFSVNANIIELQEPSSMCCLFNNCNSCCDNLCYDNSTKYPIIFLHGHSFSDSISPEYNLNIFEELQRSIESEGYINAGSLILGSFESQGVLGRPFVPVSLKASYYFDAIQEDGKTNTLYTKQDNIDTYAVRLKDIIDQAKITTNRDKVILVTHSMGGLVARRYLQIFGDNSVYEVILIASPNNGIGKEVHDPCVFFGAREECDDLYESSLLISKLKTQTSLGNVKAYNIIGLGCNTYGKDGDGVVTNSSAYLSYTTNYYINGTCSGAFDYFHNSIINPIKTPEIKEIVLEILNKN